MQRTRPPSPVGHTPRTRPSKPAAAAWPARHLAKNVRTLAGPRGFTLIELVVVMAVIALLLTLALPRYFHTLDQARVNVQRQNVAAIREAIDKFFGDQGRYPNRLGELVERRYLRAVPLDPVSESSEWAVVAPPDPTLGAVYDVRPPALPADPVPPATTATPGG